MRQHFRRKSCRCLEEGWQEWPLALNLIQCFLGVVSSLQSACTFNLDLSSSVHQHLNGQNDNGLKLLLSIPFTLIFDVNCWGC